MESSDFQKSLSDAVVECMQRKNTTDPNVGLKISAKVGCMQSLLYYKSIGATDVNEALFKAARYGHVDIVKLCKEYGAVEFEKALEQAELPLKNRYEYVHDKTYETIHLLRKLKDTQLT